MIVLIAISLACSFTAIMIAIGVRILSNENKREAKRPLFVGKAVKGKNYQGL
jgi:hypothetical protein